MSIVDPTSRSLPSDGMGVPDSPGVAPGLEELRFEMGKYAYNPKEPLAEGADGCVFLASSSDEESDGPEEIVIKEARGDGFQEQQNEYDILHRLPLHDGVIRMLEYNPADHRLLLERADGSLNSAEALRETTVQQRARWITQLAVGMKHLHDHRVVHNDINLKNLLVMGGRIKITDFGNSRYYPEGTESIQGELPDWARGMSRAEQTIYGIPYTFRRDADLANDRLDLVKVAYSILVQDTSRNRVGDDYAAQVDRHLPELELADSQPLKALFLKAKMQTEGRGGQSITDADVEQLVGIFQRVAERG